MTAFPDSLQASRWFRRIELATTAVTSAGAALLVVRGAQTRGQERGDQLKTSVDRAAEGWVLGWIESEFSSEPILAEERFSDAGVGWESPPDYWTIDALDGTRSFVEGFPGFCVQVAWVEAGKPRVGIIAEPTSGSVFMAAEGAGAWRVTREGFERIHVAGDLPSPLRFIDSIMPSGVVGQWMERTGARFVECGSCGLKLARIAEGRADIYAKRFRYRLWDAAPGEVLLGEAGGRLAQWDGTPIRYDTAQVEWSSLLVCGSSLFPTAIKQLRGGE
jgi:3'(2'), 5'-bisphosphate nucleotidase